MHIHSIIFAVISLAFLLSGVYSSCFFRMSVMDGWVRVALLVTVAFFAVASFSYSPYDSRWLVLKCRMRFIVLNVLDNAPPCEIYLEHKRQIANFSLFLETSKWFHTGDDMTAAPKHLRPNSSCTSSRIDVINCDRLLRSAKFNEYRSSHKMWLSADTDLRPIDRSIPSIFTQKKD